MSVINFVGSVFYSVVFNFSEGVVFFRGNYSCFEGVGSFKNFGWMVCWCCNGFCDNCCFWQWVCLC